MQPGLCCRCATRHRRCRCPERAPGGRGARSKKVAAERSGRLRPSRSGVSVIRRQPDPPQHRGRHRQGTNQSTGPCLPGHGTRHLTVRQVAPALAGRTVSPLRCGRRVAARVVVDGSPAGRRSGAIPDERPGHGGDVAVPGDHRAHRGTAKAIASSTSNLWQPALPHLLASTKVTIVAELRRAPTTSSDLTAHYGRHRCIANIERSVVRTVPDTSLSRAFVKSRVSGRFAATRDAVG